MGFFEKLKNGLNKTKTSFDEKMNGIFSNFRKVEILYEEVKGTALSLFDASNMVIRH